MFDSESNDDPNPGDSTHLTLNNMTINLARGNIIILPQSNIQIPLIIPQIEIGFSTVVEDVDFAVLGRSHGPGVDVHVRIDFYGCYGETGGL
jgi:hypothetical protein